MKNKWWIILILGIIIILGLAFYFISRNNSNSDNYSAERTATSNETVVQNDTNTSQNIDNSSSQRNAIEINKNSTGEPIKTEEEIASFSTKIYSKDSARQNNINITCSTLNGTVVTNGSTFSFCNTVGQSTSAKGYLEADIFDRNGNKKKGFGGGNCQVSTTLYNAVLAVPSLVVTERHEHSNKVPYIQTGKDAAVAYGSYDLKFRNDSGYDIKIYVEASTSNVTVRLVRLL